MENNKQEETTISTKELKAAFVEIIKVFSSIMVGTILLFLSVIAWIYLDGRSAQKEINKNVLVLIKEVKKDVTVNKNYNHLIRDYIRIKDEIDLEEIEDQHLWDDLIKEFRENSNRRAVDLKKAYDTIVKSNYKGGGLPDNYTLYSFSLFRNFNCIVNPINIECYE